LHARIADRVEEMFRRGLVDEVRGLLERWGELSHTAMQAVGYREVIEHLRAGRGLPETIEQVLVRTRRFARHQETWFRGLSECTIVDLESHESADQIADRLLELGQRQRSSAGAT
jgi:tRNA dimethylallyltransferase